MRASAGTDVVIDLLVFQRRADGQAPAGAAWIDLAPVARAVTGTDDEADGDNPVSSTIQVNRYFAEHPLTAYFLICENCSAWPRKDGN